MIGFRLGPKEALLGAITGAILGGFLGGATGCSIGSALGAVLDEHVLDTYRCCNCRYTFSAHQN